MKIEVDGKQILELSETQCKVIANDIPSEILDQDLRRRLDWSIMHRYDQIMVMMRKEWEPKLFYSGVKEIPFDDDEFAELVFAQADYKDMNRRLSENPC